jgi:beta-phosphoglucomutase
VYRLQSPKLGPMPARAIVFDFDGVLVDSEAVHERALLDAAAALGMTPPRGHRPGRYVGLGDVEAFALVARACGRELSPEELRRGIAIKGEAFARAIRSGSIPAYLGAVELLREAVAAVPVAVCSGSRLADIEPVLRALGVLELLATVVSADDVERTKPDPAPYRLVVQRLGLDAPQCAAIEDSPAGIASARGAGLRVHAVCHTFERDRLAGAHHLHARIADLSVEWLLA